MFEKLVTALEPYALIMVVIAGLVLTGRIEVVDHAIVGLVTVFIGVGLILIHIWKQVKKTNIK